MLKFGSLKRCTDHEDHINTNGLLTQANKKVNPLFQDKTVLYLLVNMLDVHQRLMPN